MNKHHSINYVECPVGDLTLAKRFFSAVFGWSFTDYGPEYCAFSGAGINGGFFQSDLCMSTEVGSALLVLYSDNLEATQAAIEAAGGAIVKPVFTFPGGRRLHFVDPNGNEFAVWSE